MTFLSHGNRLYPDMEVSEDKLKVVLVVPCYNEEKNVPLFVQECSRHLGGVDWCVCFVDDGSADLSWEVIEQESRDDRVFGVRLARNFGHQNAIKAGLETIYREREADIYITLDADLQHPISLIPSMIEDWQRKGVHVVQSQREDRGRRISLFKKLSSRAFYGIFSWLSGFELKPGMSDFRLMDRYAMSFIMQCRDKDFFLRGLIPWSGMSMSYIPYVPNERLYGTSKFTLKKMLSLAMNGIVGYSARPLYLSVVLGLVAICMAAIYFVYVVVVYFCGSPVSLGWSSLMMTLLAIGGLQFFLMGIVGIYLGKLVSENRSRPTYLVGMRTK